jgi:hypothetical protein
LIFSGISAEKEPMVNHVQIKRIPKPLISIPADYSKRG